LPLVTIAVFNLSEKWDISGGQFRITMSQYSLGLPKKYKIIAERVGLKLHGLVSNRAAKREGFPRVQRLDHT